MISSPQPNDPIDRALDWVRLSALPLWHELGWDQRRGGFIERLGADGRPESEAIRRMRVQARQVYVYCHAASLGWYEPARLVAKEGFSWLIDKCWAVDGAPGFIHSVSPEGNLIDGKRDAYDQAFGLLALAWAYRLDGDAQIRTIIETQLDYLDATFLDRTNGGWIEGVPAYLPRRQNPQMHAFEALIALYEATGEQIFLDRADRFVSLLEARLYDRHSGALKEYFTEDFRPASGIEGRIVEPGHHFEWTWLLHSRARMTKTALPPLASKLFDWAFRNGMDGNEFVIDEVLDDGQPHLRSLRLWPHTEFIKANAVRHESSVCPAAASRVTGMWERLLNRFMDVEPHGGWVDRFDEEGNLTDGRMLASSFYHVFGAAAETARVFRPS